jgi:hypothetical protein
MTRCLLLFVVLCLPLAGCGDSGYKSPPPVITHDADDARAMAQQFVSSCLKAPSTADFQPDSNVEDLGNGVYKVRGYVDSQNSFGAKLRSDFYVKLHWVKDLTWQSDQLQIDGL